MEDFVEASKQVFLVGNFASLLLEIWLLRVSLTVVIYLSLLF